MLEDVPLFELEFECPFVVVVELASVSYKLSEIYCPSSDARTRCHWFFISTSRGPHRPAPSVECPPDQPPVPVEVLDLVDSIVSIFIEILLTANPCKLRTCGYIHTYICLVCMQYDHLQIGILVNMTVFFLLPFNFPPGLNSIITFVDSKVHVITSMLMEHSNSF